MTTEDQQIHDRNQLRLAEAEHLYRLLDQDPSAALTEARALKCDGLTAHDLDLVRSALLIDAGQEVGDYGAVREGVAILDRIVRQEDENLSARYNLANGLSCLVQYAELQADHHPRWLLETSSIRHRARVEFHEVAELSPSVSLSGMARTNLALMLVRSGRWVEAYDTYVEALRTDPNNAIAASGAAKLLLYLAQRGTGNSVVLKGLAQSYMRAAQASVNAGRANSGKRAEKAVASVEQTDSPEWQLQLSDLGRYECFVAEHRLVLSPTVEGIEPGLERWDELRIASITERVDAPAGIPPIFGMFNGLKADFLAARWLAFRALEEPPRDSGSYSDTLDYAVYGTATSLLTLAHRSAIDILDRVAVAASEHFALPGATRTISFLGRWHKKKQHHEDPLLWQEEVEIEILAGNPALAALSELAEDIIKGGFLNPQRELRNTSTHRFVVLHDEALAEIRESPHVEHRDLMDWEQQTIKALRIARAAILYLAEAIAMREVRLRLIQGPIGQLYVPSHHEIRGQDS